MCLLPGEIITVGFEEGFRPKERRFAALYFYFCMLNALLEAFIAPAQSAETSACDSRRCD
jgi:hypothetical protein